MQVTRLAVCISAYLALMRAKHAPLVTMLALLVSSHSASSSIVNGTPIVEGLPNIDRHVIQHILYPRFSNWMAVYDVFEMNVVL